MIIKSKSHKWSAQLYARMVRYLMDDKGRADENSWSFFHNLTAGFEEQDIVQELMANDVFRKKRKNGIALQHLILSFHELDSEKIDPLILQDLTQKFLELYAPKSVAFARVHTGEKHWHVHVLVSANELGSSRSTRVSKQEFARIQRELEVYQLEKYPFLNNSIVKLRPERDQKIRKKSDHPEKPLSEQELRMKDRLGKQPTQKEGMKAQLKAFLQQADSTQAFYDLLEQHGFELYTYREKIRGFFKDGKKFRFRTIGVTEEMIQELATERDKRLSELTASRGNRSLGITISR